MITVVLKVILGVYFIQTSNVICNMIRFKIIQEEQVNMTDHELITKLKLECGYIDLLYFSLHFFVCNFFIKLKNKYLQILPKGLLSQIQRSWVNCKAGHLTLDRKWETIIAWDRRKAK